MKLSCTQRFAAAIALSIAGFAASAANAQVVISQIWGGGSTTGAGPADIVELHNVGASSVNLAGWSIQVATTTGTTWTRIPIASGTIPGKGYFLVRIATASGTGSTSANGVNFDVVSTASDILVSSGGKVALVDASNSATLSGASPIGTTGTYPPSATAGIVDYVGYGTGAGSRENTTLPGTTANNAPANSFTGPTATIRRGTRCSDNGTTPDTNVNSADFVTVTPIVWRNSLTAPLGQNFGTVSASPATIAAGASVTISGSAKQCATGSPNLAATSATADLSAVGLSSAAPLTSSDGGLTWSGSFTIPAAAAPTTYSIPVTFVTGSGNALGNASFSVLPGNDECATIFAASGAPYAFTGTGFSTSGNTALATTSTGTSLGTCQLTTGTSTNPTVKNDLYYKFTPSVDTNYNVSLCGSATNWDSVLSIHSGCPATAANQIFCNDDGVCLGGVGLSAIINQPMTAGTPYMIRVATYTTGTASPFNLQVSSDPLGTCCSPDGATCTLALGSACSSPNTFTAGNTCSANPCPIPAPANDDCSTAVVISSIPYTSPAAIQVGGALADQDIACNSTSASALNNGVWFTYTPSSNCSLSVTRTASGGFTDTAAAIFSGTCGGLTELSCSDPETVSYNLVGGTQYYILVGAYSATPVTASTTLSISANCVTPPPPPANDSCAGAVAVTSLPFASGAISVGGATPDANLSCNTGSAVNNGIWFSYTPATNCSLRVSETGSLNAVGGVYTGTCGSLSEVACTLSETAPGFDITAGTTYYILVGVEGLGTAGATDSLNVNIDCVSPAPNDNCSGAILVSSVPFSDTRNVDTLTNDDSALTDPTCNNGTATVNTGAWYHYTPATNGIISIREQSSVDSVMAVFSGTCGSLSQLGCSDGDPTTGDEFYRTLSVTAGTELYILVGDWGASAPTAGSVMNITIDLLPSATNDDCSTAKIMTASNYTDSYSAVSATADLDVACNAPAATGLNNSAWYTYTPSVNSLATFAETGSLDTVLAVFTGTCGSLSEIACSDPETLNLSLNAGTQYYFVTGIYSATSSTSATAISVTFSAGATPPAPSNDTCTGATLITSLPYTSGNIANAGATADANGSCNSSGTTQVNNGVWFTYTPTSNCNFFLGESTAQDAIFVVFTGDCSFPLENYCSLSDTDSGIFSAAAGTQYFILVGRQGTTNAGISDNLNFSLDCINPPAGAPANDDCATATVIASLPFDSGNILASLANDDIDVTCNSSTSVANHGVWFSWTATAGCPSINIAETGSLDTSTAVFTGTCGSLTQVACSDPEASLFNGTDGTQYYIMVSRYATTALATFDSYRVTASCFVPIANDQCNNALPITVGQTIMGNTLNATGTAEASCTIAAEDVWYVFTPTVTASYTFTGTVPGAGSADATALAVFTGCGGSMIGCNNPGTSAPVTLTVSLSAGSTYYLRVARYADLNSPDGLGSFVITLDGPPQSADAVCCRGTTCAVTSSASCTAPAGVGVTFQSAMTTCNASGTNTSPCCYADFNKDGNRNIDDIFIYLNAWFGTASNPYTKIGGNGVTNANIDDLFIFINVWFAGGCG
jgi:hypothetical protein